MFYHRIHEQSISNKDNSLCFSSLSSDISAAVVIFSDDLKHREISDIYIDSPAHANYPKGGC